MMTNATRKTIDAALKSLARDEALKLRIDGHCMEPLVRDGALIEVRHQSTYWPGDILIKRCPFGQLVAHRLLGYYRRRGQLYFITRADNADHADGAVAESQIIGRITGGACHPSAVSIPLLSRLKASAQFAALALRRLTARSPAPD